MVETPTYNPESAENIELESREASPENNNQSEPSSAVKTATANDREVRKKQRNVEDLTKWLTENEVDPDFVNKFKEAVLQNESSDQNLVDSKNLDETIEFIQKLPKHLEKFLTSISKLEEKPEFSKEKLKDKKSEIIKGMCLSVSNGHLTAEDALCSIKGIEIVSKTNPPADKKSQIEMMIQMSGYDAVLYFNRGKIVIFEESLADDFKNSSGKSMRLDFKHLLNHELSHSLVEKAVGQNKNLNTKINEIIENASEIKDLQSQHVINVLDGLANLKSDFEKSFADNEAKSQEYLALDDEGKTKAKETAEKTFIAKRKARAANEIMTDYTAIYLQSDGTMENFSQVCLQKVDHVKFAECLGVSKMRIREINNCKTQEEKGAMLEKFKQNSPKFAKALEIYSALFHEIKKSITENKGQFAELSEEENELGLGGLGGIPESAGDFSKDSGSKSDEGTAREFFALMNDMAEAIGAEVAPSELSGGQVPK